MERDEYADFNFSQFVTALVVAAIHNDPEIGDVLTIAAQDTVHNLVGVEVDNLNLVQCDEFDELADRVHQTEEDLDTSDECVENLEKCLEDIEDRMEDMEDRMDAFEKESVLEEDFQHLEREFIRLEKTFSKYQPLLELLSKVEPVLRRLGLVHAEETTFNYHQHPKYVSKARIENPMPVVSWQN